MLNFINSTDQLLSVDWENSGWGDAAFEIAELTLHPAYLSVDEARWQWVIQQYAARTGQHIAEARIHRFRCILAVWWIVRCARYIYEMPRKLDVRLAQNTYDLADLEVKMQRYLATADQLLDTI